MNDFKPPEQAPQDLLLIQGLIGHSEGLPLKKAQHLALEAPVADCITSSESEDEIEADLVIKLVENSANIPSPVPSDSESDSGSSSDAESDFDESSNGKNVSINLNVQDQCDDDDDDLGPVAATATYLQTKNEVVETDIVIPEIEEVRPEEVLEKVGEIMSIIDKLVIIKGIASEISDRAAERALDSDTLLVFEDRKVLGYVYETFGPTSQPLYQVKFTHNYPLDLEKVRISREVFHVPQRSRFVFLSQIKHLKGSDASNLYDEEPADHELEFSDDEMEAAFKAARKRKRGESRADSVVSSRHATPTPSQIRDQDLANNTYLGANAYDEHGPYDVDFSARSLRPPPIPYDDPYSEEYNASTSNNEKVLLRRPETMKRIRGQSSTFDNDHGKGRGRGRGRGRGGRGQGMRKELGHQSGPEWGNYGDHGRGDRSEGPPLNSNPWTARAIPQEVGTPHDPRGNRPLSPTSLAIARATGQFPDGSNFTSQHCSPILDAVGPWPLQQPYHAPHHSFNPAPQGYPQHYVQPHINPRFASAFGMNLEFMQPQQYAHYGLGMGAGSVQETHPSSNWTDEWTVHVAEAGDTVAGNAPSAE